MSGSLSIQAIDFTNHLGHVIKPGDKVVAIAQGYNKSLNIREAEYVGCRIDSRGNVESVTVRALFKGRRYNVKACKYEYSEKIRATTLPSKRIYPLAMPLAALEVL